MGILDLFTRKKPAANGHRPRFEFDDDDGPEFMAKGVAEDFAAAAWMDSPGEVTAGQSADRYFSWYASFVWAAVAMNARANNAASVPIRCVKIKADETTEDLPYAHPLRKLMRKPNQWRTKRRFIKRTMLNLDATGRAFFLMGEGKPESIFLLNPGRMKIVPDKDKFIREYVYDVPHKGGQVNRFRYSTDEVWHHVYDDPRSEYAGLTPLETLTSTLQSEDYIRRWNRATFRNNCRVDQVFEAEGSMGPPAKRRFLAEFFQAFRGPDNQGKTFIAENGLKLKQLGLSPKDTEFLAQLKVNWREILAMFGVTPAVVGITEDINYATANEQRRAFWENTMVPILCDLSEALTDNVAVRFGEDLAILFDFDKVEALKENSNERATRLQVLRATGVLSADEVREEMGYEAIGSPVMQAVVMPGMLMDPITGEAVGPQPEPVAPEDEEEEPPEKAMKSARASKEFRELAWRGFDRNARRLIKVFARGVRKFFEGQRDRVLEKFGAFQQKSINVGFDPFDSDEEAQRFARELKGEYLEAIQDAGDGRADELNVREFNAASERIERYIMTTAAKRIVRINQETEERVRQTMLDGFQQGESIDQLAKRLETLFDSFNRPLSDNEPRFTRADTIARTETNASLNFGNHEAEQQAIDSGAKLVKQWVANPRPSAREEHVEIGDQTADDPIPWDQPFSNGLMYPHDPNGDASQTINCTCTSISFPAELGRL